ncbi:unnamed protein product [Rotaria sp. Silwood2]|nr:unnamed protein product [Rotaria sp. Silwood2]CAF2995654.1 unnamed protein product [Rotaria sp. Silwood2]CAF3493506.1 unnamed protein product [Rotaria sp. Silwood2]CAF4466445.1 unnamed protein product [Rotaria sp. Silwood2]CAF4504139.1 unnamed protein product [Rotaria sp. Silwood2]
MFVLIEWIRHQHDEIDRAPSTDSLTMEYLNSMQFIEACIHEVLRRSTNSRLGLRYADREFSLSDGKCIPSGNIVAAAITHAKDLYLNPEKNRSCKTFITERREQW